MSLPTLYPSYNAQILKFISLRFLFYKSLEEGKNGLVGSYMDIINH